MANTMSEILPFIMSHSQMPALIAHILEQAMEEVIMNFIKSFALMISIGSMQSIFAGGIEDARVVVQPSSFNYGVPSQNDSLGIRLSVEWHQEKVLWSKINFKIFKVFNEDDFCSIIAGQMSDEGDEQLFFKCFDQPTHIIDLNYFNVNELCQGKGVGSHCFKQVLMALKKHYSEAVLIWFAASSDGSHKLDALVRFYQQKCGGTIFRKYHNSAFFYIDLKNVAFDVKDNVNCELATVLLKHKK